MLGIIKISPLPLFLLCLLLYAGCKNSDEGEPATFGWDTLSSESRWSGEMEEFQGFDFSEARIRYASFQGVSSVLDICIQAQPDCFNADFYLPDGRNFIQRMFDITALEEITEAPADGYASSATNIWAGFYYCVLTTEGNYAKIHITDLECEIRPDGTPYAWVRFKWVYQPDGGRFFGGG